MPLATCERCNKMFSKTGDDPICPKCRPEEDEDYERIRDSLQDNPNQTAEQVSEGTGVELTCVLRCIETGRIQNIATSREVRCGMCGSPAISLSKKLCQACLNKLTQDVAKAQSRIRLPKKQDVELGKALNLGEGPAVRVARSLDYRNRPK